MKTNKTCLLIILINLALYLPEIALANPQRIRQNLMTELEQNKNLGRHEFIVDVRGAVVTLEGFVSSELDKKVVEKVAWQTAGVSKVISRLEVQGPTDQELTDLTKAIRNAVKARGYISGYELEIRHQGGEIELRGNVSSTGDKLEIGSIADSISRNKKVKNELLVRDRPRIDDALVKSNLENVLKAEQPAGLEGVLYSVRDGVVYFSGHVANHREIDRILSMALMVEGVTDVKSNVEISTSK